MDIKAEVVKLVAKFTGDPDLLSKFKGDPIGTVKSLVGETFSADDIKNIADQIKDKLPAGGVADAVGKITGMLG